jgi:hypothetical protein
MGPAQLPADIVAKIEADTRRVLAEVEVRERLSQAVVEPMDGDGTALAQSISADLARYADLGGQPGSRPSDRFHWDPTRRRPDRPASRPSTRRLRSTRRLMNPVYRLETRTDPARRFFPIRNSAC